MKNLIVALMLAGSLVACAHSEKNVEQTPAPETKSVESPVAFEGRCANSVCHDDMKTMGKKEFSMEHNGKTYYFSSAKARDNFKKDLLNNLNNANKNWSRSGRTI